MDNEELGRKVRKLYGKFVDISVKAGYDEPSIEDFLEWLDSLLSC